jgi:sugar phosphate isomerase/epimerase
MRLVHPDGQTVHLAYCTNVHPADDLAGVLAQLDRYAEPVRRELGVDRLGLGLWLAQPVAAELAASVVRRAQLRHELDVRGLEVVTLNGFPYGSFHADVVKHAVYTPDWTDPRRLAYTLHLATVLADLLPDGVARGSVSTLPLGWREPWGIGQVSAAQHQLAALAEGLAEIEWQSGRAVRVAFEPEPGCAVETTDHAVAALSDVDTKRIGVCLDLAHLACAWEDPEQSVRALQAAGLPVVKVQVSAALEVAQPAAAAAVLADYVEPRFLHQTRSAAGAAFDDLPEALAYVLADGLAAGDTDPWRVHFHVPLHAAPEPPLAATVPVLRAGLAALLGGATAVSDHFEVETYTWTVLPALSRPRNDAELVRGIAAELSFTAAELVQLGLKESP